VPELKRKYPKTVFVEDNCEGFCGTYENKQTGTESFASAVSFYGNKNITAGEGGAFITNDEDTYNFAKCIQGQGQSSKRFVHSHLGYNYRITNIQAAILLGQLETLHTILDMKRDVFETYRKHIGGREDILLQEIDPNTTNANWMLGVRIPKQKCYEEAETFFKNRDIEVRPMFYPITEHKYLHEENIKFSDCKVATQLNKECLILPSYPELKLDEVSYIYKTLDEYIKTI
jgi:perosamine synthetase